MGISEKPLTASAGRATITYESAESRDDDRVSLAPLDPETALRALLATPPLDEGRDQE